MRKSEAVVLRFTDRSGIRWRVRYREHEELEERLHQEIDAGSKEFHVEHEGTTSASPEVKSHGERGHP